MTVHSAKGLEFDSVFITGLEEGLFPHENSVMEPNGLEEERRLMYVAITRARQRLYLSLAQTRMLHGQTRYNMRSRFLDELPKPMSAGSHQGLTLKARWVQALSTTKADRPTAIAAARVMDLRAAPEPASSRDWVQQPKALAAVAERYRWPAMTADLGLARMFRTPGLVRA